MWVFSTSFLTSFWALASPTSLFFLAVGKLIFIWFSKSVNQASMSLVNSKGVNSAGRLT